VQSCFVGRLGEMDELQSPADDAHPASPRVCGKSSLLPQLAWSSRLAAIATGVWRKRILSSLFIVVVVLDNGYKLMVNGVLTMRTSHWTSVVYIYTHQKVIVWSRRHASLPLPSLQPGVGIT